MAQPDTSENGNERQRITATTPLHRHLLNEWYRDGRALPDKLSNCHRQTSGKPLKRELPPRFQWTTEI